MYSNESALSIKKVNFAFGKEKTQVYWHMNGDWSNAFF